MHRHKYNDYMKIFYKKMNIYLYFFDFIIFIFILSWILDRLSWPFGKRNGWIYEK